MATLRPVAELTAADIGKHIRVVASDPNDNVEGCVVAAHGLYSFAGYDMALAMLDGDDDDAIFLAGDQFEFVGAPA